MFELGLVLCLCLSVSLGSEDSSTYRAGFIDAPNFNRDPQRFLPLIDDAAKSNVDILVLPSPDASSMTHLDSCEADNYDELVKTLSDASRRAGVYLVAHLLEISKCQNKNEIVRSNLVFDREGNVVSVYRKPVNPVTNCTIVAKDIGSFNTDFGVKFGLLMEEDLAIKKTEDLKGLKNFVVVGSWSNEIPFLTASQFASTWAFTNDVNLVSTYGIFAGRSGRKSDGDAELNVADMNKDGEKDAEITPPVINSANLASFPAEDLSLYVTKPLDMAASIKGYKETVCHDSFCCQFYVKTSIVGSKPEDTSYVLSAFSGARSFGRHHLGSQACLLGSGNNSTNIVFEKISVSGNFSQDNVHPIILTAGSDISSKQFSFDTKTTNVKTVTMEVDNTSVLNFGIFGRDVSKDSEKVYVSDTEQSSDIYEYIINDMQELFDYIWIRLRILIFIVSIYVLEML